MSPALLAFIAVLICLLFRILNVVNQPTKPVIHGKDTKFIQNILKACPELNDTYTPTRLWGFSGHIQSILHALIGRVQCQCIVGDRHSLLLPDGSTVTYDQYDPLIQHETEDDYSLIICPGIGNSSETVYIRAFVHGAQRKGYRCAVLNHLGALQSVKLTTPRIFTYGGTEEYDVMIRDVNKRYSRTKLILVGFSMGGNIITKYLGDDRNSKPDNILGGISVSQGYDAEKGLGLLLSWENFRRMYLYIMTENVRRIIMRNRGMLLSTAAKKEYNLDERKIASAASLIELDEAYSRRARGFDSLAAFYKENSSSTFVNNINHPIIFINALDDPIVPPPLLDIPRSFAERHCSSAYIEMQYGGHLGFFEKNHLYPDLHTWLDRVVPNLADGLVYNSIPA